jgi:hypothetical protein
MTVAVNSPLVLGAVGGVRLLPGALVRARWRPELPIASTSARVVPGGNSDLSVVRPFGRVNCSIDTPLIGSVVVVL